MPVNQGVINGRITALFNDKDALTTYVSGLTVKQRDRAREHARTVVQLRKLAK
jgi:hypothetical protein